MVCAVLGCRWRLPWELALCGPVGARFMLAFRRWGPCAERCSACGALGPALAGSVGVGGDGLFSPAMIHTLLACPPPGQSDAATPQVEDLFARACVESLSLKESASLAREESLSLKESAGLAREEFPGVVRFHQKKCKKNVVSPLVTTKKIHFKCR